MAAAYPRRRRSGGAGVRQQNGFRASLWFLRPRACVNHVYPVRTFVVNCGELQGRAIKVPVVSALHISTALAGDNDLISTDGVRSTFAPRWATGNKGTISFELPRPIAIHKSAGWK
jgi:hypothetical protein